jgi:hypothetical protein
MARIPDSERTQEDDRKIAERQARQAQQAVDGRAAMAEYRQAQDEVLNRMARLREAR